MTNVTPTDANVPNDTFDITRQAEFYDSRWQNEAYGATYANHLKMMRCAAILNALAGAKLKQPLICDLGCGTGWLASVLGLFGPTTGLELSPAAVDAARKRYPHVRFESGDVFTWEHRGEPFDVIVSQEVIEHVEEQDRYLEIAHRLLRPGGVLILTTPNARTFNTLPEATRRAWTNQPIEKWLTMSQLHSLVEANFDVVRLTSIIPGYGRGSLDRIWNARRVSSVMRAAHLQGWFERARLDRGYGLHLLCVAEKRKSESGSAPVLRLSA